MTIVLCETMFLRRLGIDSNATLTACASGRACPDILEMSDGYIAVIGRDITAMSHGLPAGSGCGEDERIVRIPREILLRALRDGAIARD
jgi:hypothetical protein